MDFSGLAAVIAGGKLQREALELFGNDTHNSAPAFVFGINAMNGLAAHFARVGSLKDFGNHF
jgi:hypothetical protein